MTNFFKLNFKSNFLKEGLNFESLNAAGEWQTFSLNPKDCLTKEAYTNLQSINIYPDTALLFKGTPSKSTQIHIDGYNNIARLWAINISWGSVDSSMSWYRINNQSTNLNYTNANTPFITFNNDDVEEIERVRNAEGPILVRVNVPHRVENFDNKNFRYCFSLRGISNYKSWEEVVSAFSNFIE